MRKLIFLDFDGVLHPDGVALFSQRALLESYLGQMPAAEIVISSSWRETEPLAQLRSYFSPQIHERIVGVTPSLDGGYDSGGRQLEILAFMESEDLNAQNSSWVALDDVAHFFQDGCPNLILTDSSKGFSDSEGELLLAWYRRVSRSG